MGGTKHRTLYICYFGLREPLVQTQVLPYLREIRKADVDVSLLTFEPEPKNRWTPQQFEEERKRLADEGIDWNWKTYHKRPSVPATLLDIISGACFTWRQVRAGVDVIHARIHVPAAMAVLAKTFSGRGKVKVLFDIRGFFPEEYTDAGVWKADGFIYRCVKKVEKWLLRNSHGFVVLTEKARGILFPESADAGWDSKGRPVEVIPCCVDSGRFRRADDWSRGAMRKRLGIKDRKVAVYLGSFGGWYMTDEIIDLFAAARARDASSFALILTQSDGVQIESRLRAKGFGDGDFLVRKVSPAEVPGYLSAGDFAVSFIKPCFSKLSSSPTKMAEYFACGLPVIANRGVGDIAECVEGHRVGTTLEVFSPEEFERVLDEIEGLISDEGTADRCRRAAREEFDLQEVGGVRYRRLYGRLLGS